MLNFPRLGLSRILNSRVFNYQTNSDSVTLIVHARSTDLLYAIKLVISDSKRKPCLYFIFRILMIQYTARGDVAILIFSVIRVTFNKKSLSYISLAILIKLREL